MAPRVGDRAPPFEVDTTQGPRSLATLLDGVRDAGCQSVVWNGRDRSGRDVSSGVYWARLTTSGATDAVRVVRLRTR